MKRIKAINGYTIFQATERDTKRYNVEADRFYIYFSSDVRDYGLTNCDPDWEADSEAEAIEWASSGNYAIAKEIAESRSTAASFDEIEEIEKQLDSGMTPEEIEEAEEESSGLVYATEENGLYYVLAQDENRDIVEHHGPYYSLEGADLGAQNYAKNTGGRFHYVRAATLDAAPVYLEESWPTSNSVEGVCYKLGTETRAASWLVTRYTVDDLQTAIQYAKQNGEKITSCTRCEYDPTTGTTRETPIIPETRQEKTDRENREHCKRISDELDLYVDGLVWRCPECGETFTEDQAPSTTEDVCFCPHCQEPISVHDLEQLSLWDYFSDFLDMDWVLDSRREYKACRIMVAYGGPTIYIDTLTGYVELYWWSDRASYKLRSDTLAAVDEWAEEYFSC